MKPIPRPFVNDTPYHRIDAMPMGASDRELAKARMQDGERFADAVWTARIVVRSWVRRVSRRVRMAIATST
jgi:hypothetical protein